MNDSLSEDSLDDSDEGSVLDLGHSMNMVSLVIFNITCVLGIPGNAFVIWIAGVKMKRTVNTIWYVNLAVADLLWCLAIPFSMTQLVVKHWPFGAALCKIISSVYNFNVYASVFTLILISLDRLSLVIWPVWAHNHRSVFGAWLLCGLAWFLALLLNMPDLIYRGQITFNNTTFCDYDDDSESITRAIYVSKAVVGFFIPLLVITVCSLLIARRLRVGRFQKSQKALWIMAGVVTAFFVCWMPLHVANLVIEYGEGRSYDVAHDMFPLAVSLACVNSCLNPVLYVFMGQDFKDRARFSLRRIFENAFGEDAALYSVSSRSMSRVTYASEAQV